MPDSSELVKSIIHYQKALDRYSDSRNDAKILHCIFKLFNMPVTVKHLEKTGIGRTVNSLRKLGGEVEDAAKTLVKKWKDMVSGNDEAEESDSKSNGTSNAEETESNSSHKHSDKYRNSDRKEKSNKDDKYKHSKESKYDDYRHQSTSESKHKSSSSKYSKPEDDRNLYESKDEEDNESGVASESEQSSIEEEEIESVVSPKVNKYERDGKKAESKEVRHKESSSERTSKYKRDSGRDRKRERSRSKENTRKRESRSENEQKKSQKSDSSSSDSEHVSRAYSSSSKSNSSKRKHSDSTSDEEVKKKLTKKSPTQNSHRSSNSHRSKDSSSESKRESKSNVDDNSHKSSSHKSRESSSSRDKKENKPDFDKKESSTSSKNDLKYEKRKSESSRDDRPKTENDRPKKESSSSKTDRKHTNNEKVKHKSSSKSSSSSSSSKMVDIGSESGTSFAEALGMLEPTASKSNKKFKSTPETPSYKVERPEKERFKDKVVTEKPFKGDKIDIVIPPPPPKADIDINISSLLPPITPNYRPVSNPILDNCSTRSRIMNDDEALSLVMTQKNMRTKVYSGNKCFFGTVPTLFELCIRILQDNIDALEYTGGVPYAILKPIIDKATPDQLFMLEHHNPYLIEDTDEIWKFHCQKEFRNKKREELESWREMYMRCLDEREAKLKALTENIKLAQDKSIPVRQTKLAYVDSVVKPPRDVIRKQVKSGFIDKKPIVTPSSRLSSLAAAGAAGQVAVPSPVRASSSSGSSAAIKPKKAPLMQKTLQFMKGNRFRR